MSTDSTLPPCTSTVPDVYRAIADVSRELAETAIGKGSRNEAQGFNFRGIDAVHNALAVVFARHGLGVFPFIQSNARSEYLSNAQKPQFRSLVTVTYQVTSLRDGTSITVAFDGEGVDSGDKATSKALSMAYKYMAIQTFSIPVKPGTVDDADSDIPADAAPKGSPATQPSDDTRGKPGAQPPAEAPKEPPTARLPTSFDEVLAAVKVADAKTLEALRGPLASLTKTPDFVKVLKTAYLLRKTELAPDDKKAAEAYAGHLKELEATK